MNTRRLLLLLLALLVIMSFTAVPALAESLPDYDGNYTAQFAKDNFTKNGSNNWTHDCVKYGRYCLEAGGVPRDTLRGTIGYTSSDYGDYLVSYGYADMIWLNTDSKGRVTVKGNEGNISPGDIMVNFCLNPDCPKPGFHTSVVYENDGTYWKQYHHSRSGHPGFGYVQTYSCSKCGNNKANTACICYHIKSNENGYTLYKGQVKNVAASRYSYNKIKVTWSKNRSATAGYRVFYMNKAKKWFRVAGDVDANTTEFMYKVEDPNRYGQDVQFFVMPLKINKKGGQTPNVGYKSDIVTAYTTPNLPTNAKGKRVSSTKVKVTWTKGKGETGCQIEYRYAGKKKWYTAGTTTKTSYTISGLKANKKVIIRLRPYCKGKGGTKYRDVGRLVSVK